MPESAPPPQKPAPDGQEALDPTKPRIGRHLPRIALSFLGFTLWFWATLAIVTALDQGVFPRLFPPGLLQPKAQPHSLLIQAMLLLMVGFTAAGLLSPARRLLALRLLPTLVGLFGLTFWLGGGEVAQLDEQGLWRTQALGVADEFHPWPSIQRLTLVPYAWRRQSMDGLQAELRLRLAIVPAGAPASLVDLGPRVDWLRLEALLATHAPLVTAAAPEGLAASLYRFEPDAPAADLLARYLKPVPAPVRKPLVRPNDPIEYWWWKNRHRRR